jgi:putative sterol carrier protein
MGMADATANFFTGLSGRGPEPLLGKLHGTVRFDLADGRRTDHWLVTVDDGALDVLHGTGDADCILSATREAFDEVASGRTNPMAAYLRGAVTIEGEALLFVRFQRLFPAPVGMPKSAGERTIGKRRG